MSLNWRQTAEDWDEFYLYRDGKVFKVVRPDRDVHKWTYAVPKPVRGSVFGVSAVKNGLESETVFVNDGNPMCE